MLPGLGRPLRPALWLGLLLTACGLALWIALAVGSVPIGPGRVLAALFGDGDRLHLKLVWELRLPRALSALAVGGLLALAGTLIQVLVMNPLGDPYVLGVSGGAASGALIGALLGLAGPSSTAAAVGGAMVSMLLVFVFARGPGDWTPERLLLTGVVLASGWGALIGLLLSISPPQRMPGMLFWLMGDLGHPGHPFPALVLLMLGMLLALALAGPLNLLTAGEIQAAALGVSTAPLRLGLFLLTSALTAIAVTLAGNIGFVGLIAPHMARRLLGSDHRRLIPGAILLGATLLVLADTLARTLVAPQQLPVGIITALLGVPLFLFLLQRRP